MIISKTKVSISSIITKPIQKLCRSKPINKGIDTVEISGVKFTKLEQELMNEVREYSKEKLVETAKIIDKKGALINNLKTIESEYFVTLIDNKDFKIFGHKPKNDTVQLLGKLLKGIKSMYKGTMIHSHIINGPLSSQDLKPFIFLNMKKVLATTPDGYFSYIGKQKHSNILVNIRRTAKARKQLGSQQTQKAIELGLITKTKEYPFLELNHKNGTPEQLKEYSDFSIKLLQDFANKFGFEFKHNFPQ